MEYTVGRLVEESTPEIQFLLLCAHSRLSPDDIETIRAEARRIDNWVSLIDLARYHRVVSLLHNSLKVAGVSVPDPEWTFMTQYVRRASTWNTFLTIEMTALVSAMAAEGIRVLPFKGPVLAAMAYQRPEHRPFTDLDLLIAPSDVPALQDFLKKRGYRSAGSNGSTGQREAQAQIWLNRQFQFVKGNAVYNLDVHLDIVSPLYTYGISFQELWDRSVPLQLLGHEIRIFSDEDQLLILCYQGIKDRWERLKYVADVAELIQARPNLNWDLVHALARSSHAGRLLQLGLSLARELLGATVPESMVTLPRVASLSRFAANRLLHMRRFDIPDITSRFWFHMGVQETAASKIRYCTYSLVRNLYDAMHPRGIKA